MIQGKHWGSDIVVNCGGMDLVYNIYSLVSQGQLFYDNIEYLHLYISQYDFYLYYVMYGWKLGFARA